MSLDFLQIQLLTTEIAAIECLKNKCLHFFSVAIDLIIFKLADKEEMHNMLYFNLSQIGLQTTELPALENQKRYPIRIIMGKMVSTVTYLRTFYNVLMTAGS